MTESLSNENNSVEKKNVPWVRPHAVTSISPHSLGRVSEVMILDSQCGVLVHKRSLQNIPYRKAQQVFARNMKIHGQKYLSPYFRDENIDFFYLSKTDIYLVAVHPSQAESAISVVVYLDFLHRLYEILRDCIGTVNEPYITVNRMLVFEILHEVMNCGYAFVSSYTEIKPHLTFDPIRPKIPQQDELASRFFGIYVADKSKTHTGQAEPKHKSPNAAYINIVEGLSAVLGANGDVYSSELWGKLTLISTLERPAPILIQLNPDLMVQTSGAVQGQVAGVTCIENPSFHSCVDTSQLGRKRLLRVLPPAEQTRLMIYTLSDSSCIRIPIVVIPSLVAIEGSKDQNLSLRLINQSENCTTASYIRVKVRLPECVTSVSTMKYSEQQSGHFDVSEKVAVWELERSCGSSEAFITFRLIKHTGKVLDLKDIGPISVTFNIKHFSASGLVVKMARIEGHVDSVSASPPPDCYFGVCTKAVSYSVRTEQTVS